MNKKDVLKNILKKYTGKGGPGKESLFTEAASPINLLKSGQPPTAKAIPKTKVNY